MTTTIQKWGNSQGIRIPKFILETLNWTGSERLVVSAGDDKIIIERAERRKNIKELFADYHEEYTPIEIDWGEPVGEEVWSSKGILSRLTLTRRRAMNRQAIDRRL